MSLPVVTSCPLGHKCEEARDGAIHRCRWYTRVIGANPQTGEQQDHYDCAMVWMPVLLIENSQQQRQTGAAVESFRNEMVKANRETQQFLLQAPSPPPRYLIESN